MSNTRSLAKFKSIEELVVDIRSEQRAEKRSKSKPKKNKIIKSIIEWTIYAIVFALIVWGTPKALSIALNTDYPIASITSSSMWPVMKQGDIVLIQGVSGKEDINEGDIVVFKNEKGFTIHRVIQMNEDTFVTKGDANNIEDQPVSYDELVGKAVKYKDKPVRIPYLGKLSLMVNKN